MSNQGRPREDLSIPKIRFRLRHGNARSSHIRVTNAPSIAIPLIENGRDAMASDGDVEMVDAELLRFSTVEKGKAKAPEPVLPEEDDGLPWCVGLFVYPADPSRSFVPSG